LELAATALFLYQQKQPDPWAETANRKPEKSEGGRLEKAKRLYAKLQDVNTIKQLPSF
jgi:hypothetical protein